MADWENRICVITGAASGIGAGLARHATSLGMQVFAADIDEKGLRVLQQELKDNSSVHIQTLDVTDGDAFLGWADQIFSEVSAVHLFFNNAGVLVDGKSWERSERDWRWNIDVNVMGVVNGIRAFVPHMLSQIDAGRIINTSSIGGLLGGGQYMAPYQASKHAVAAISESLYQELSLEPAPISASCLCPGEVDTGIWSSDRLREESNVLASEAEQQFHDHVAGMVAAGLSPDEFALRVWEGIEADKFWILPQPEFKPMYQARVDTVMLDTNPRTMAELMKEDV